LLINFDAVYNILENKVVTSSPVFWQLVIKSIIHFKNVLDVQISSIRLTADKRAKMFYMGKLM